MRNTKTDLAKNQSSENKKNSDYEYLLDARSKVVNTKKEIAGFSWLTEHSRNFLAAGYVADGVKAEERIREIANRAEEILKLPGFSDKFYDYMEKGYYSLSSPVWSNFGKKRGLPISCFGSNVADDMGNILYTQSEVGMMSKLGGGTSGYFGNIRHRGASVKDNGEAYNSYLACTRRVFHWHYSGLLRSLLTLRCVQNF